MKDKNHEYTGLEPKDGQFKCKNNILLATMNRPMTVTC